MARRRYAGLCKQRPPAHVGSWVRTRRGTPRRTGVAADDVAANGRTMMDLGIQGLRVLVTAGAAGIGRAIVEAFAEEGARVFTCDVDGGGLTTLPASVGHRVTDVADRAAVGALVEAAVAQLGGLDVLVNNAGIAG